MPHSNFTASWEQLSNGSYTKDNTHAFFIGFPHVVYDMPSAAFDAKKLDNVAMNGKDANMTGVNPLIGIQEVSDTIFE